MSSYRSYTPWKTSLGSSYKTGGASYSSRDDIAGSSSGSRYSSLATPSAYRPSFSGGTYRIKRDPPPPPVTSYVSRYGSAKLDAKDTSTSDVRDKTSPIKRYTGASSTLSKYGRSRDPSPVAVEHTNRLKSREPSPVRTGLRGKSRDPSPVIDSGRAKLGGSYRMGVGSASSGSSSRSSYNSRYGGNSRLNSTLSTPDKSISYLTTSDFHARTASRARFSREKEVEQEEPAPAPAVESTPAPVISINGVDSALEEQEQQQAETFVSVSVVTRATSPTPPGSTTVQRTRRIDIAKTIEKTIQRSTKPRQMVSQEVQSDRLDDSTRYLRYGAGSGASSYSPHKDRISSLRYSASPQSSSSPKSSSAEPRAQEAQPRSGSGGNSGSSSKPKSKLSPPKVVRLTTSRQSSVENLANKPPAPPSKSESPTKSVSASGSSSSSAAGGQVVKWPNKDFRKSSLNVGPTDRPRKSRTPSSGAESETQEKEPTTTQGGRLERSPSGGSEASIASTSSARRGAKVANGRCQASKSPSQSRPNSVAQPRAHKSCAPASANDTASSGSGSASATNSGDSSSEGRGKTGKRNAKKKTSSNSHNKDARAKQTGEAAATGGSQNSNINNQKTATSAAATETATATTVAATDSRSQSQRSVEASQSQSQSRLQKLASVSNFFATRQHDANSEPIFLESSESSGELDALPLPSNSRSLATEFKSNTTNNSTNTKTTPIDILSEARSEPDQSVELQTITTSSELDPPCTSRSLDTKAKATTTASPSSLSSSTRCPRETTTTTTNSSTNGHDQSLSSTTTRSTTEEQEPDQEEPSWWQDTSLQINTASALDFNNRDEMRYRLRHIDSGEQAWWLRQDEAGDENENDDTLAEETLNQLDDEAEAEATEPLEGSTSRSRSKAGGWWSSAGVEEVDEDEDETTNDAQRNELHESTSNGHEVEAQLSWTVKKMPRSRISPENAWWLEEEEEEEKENGHSNGNAEWRPVEDENNNEHHVEATIKLPSKQSAPLERSPSSHKTSSIEATDNGKHWWLAGPTKKLFNVQRVESGERAWWQESEEKPVVKPPTPPPRIIRHWESGERAWWLNDAEQENEEEEEEQQQTEAERDEVDRQQNGSRCRHDAEVLLININHPHANGAPIGNDAPTELSSSFNFEYSVRPPPLGQCASPVPLSEPRPPSPPPRKLCASPYDNIPMSKVQMAAQQPPSTSPPQSQSQSAQRYSPNARRASTAANGGKLFISRHQNIDELLGGACRPLSPLFFGCGSGSGSTESGAAPLASKNMFLLEEITPDQVRIHDSTAQLPVIQRMQRDEWGDDSANGGGFYDQRGIDDAAIQVYKDGDYGAYLDLESSLAEQAEEIEGLNASRKNSLVVRTQLSVRVHAIIEKLLSAEGSDLRRALFSLKQVFQEDKDLVHAFVALGGLNCLVRVGNCADQNYQNYILRALGQVMLYVDGMNGVMRHEPTMQWLYSLIASNYRSVVKTALKLLLVFVEYAESNCYVLVSAIHAVDAAQGTLPWSHIMRLLKDYDNADAELVIYATSLINKTLAGLNDQDSFYDESDLLEQQGMEAVIQRYMSKPGTDLDLLDQLQLYEAVLKFEDGESDGQRLPENSMRKTQRYRPGTSTTERRKSRRHSTDNSPAPLGKLLPCTPMRMTPTQATLDEDSSGSTNSTEFSGGLFQEKKPRDGAGVTPGLRRRRERAERHKSFLKEQQEAAANGIFAALEQREVGLGQIVTAIPATIQGGDSPPQSLQIDQQSHCNNNITASPATNNNSHNNNNNSSATAPDTPNNSLLLSPSKQLLSGSNSISIINNSFDKANNNNGNSANEFLTKKNLFRERNATVINGIMKNIQQTTDSAYKKYENDANRLNNYYTQLSQSPKHQPQAQAQLQHAQDVLAAVLSPKKTLNGFDFTQASSTPVAVSKCEPELDLGLELPGSQPISPIHKTVTADKPTRAMTTVAMAPLPPPPPPPPPPGWWRFPIPPVQPARPLTTPSVPSTNQESKVVDLAQAMPPADCGEDKSLLLQLKRDHTVKDLTQKLSNLPTSPTQEPGNRAIVGDMSGLISKAKEGLAKSKSKGEISRSSSVDQELKKSEPKKSENELHWEELVRNRTRTLNLCDLDFTDLQSDDEKDVLAPRGLGVGIPRPPPLLGSIAPPPMMPPPPSYSGYGAASMTNSVNSSMNGSINGELGSGNNTIKKNKKTVKLFWKEVREDMIPVVVGKTIWDELPNANVDTQKLEHLFESRAKDLMIKKQQDLNKSKEIIVLDHKRSNAINIAITKMPPPRAIKAAILKMDATVVTREGIDKLLNMLPTDEERGKIQEAQMTNPELPLGSAEQFLLTLASISELGARLKLWAFRLDFDNSEKEIAEPLMDLKQGIEILRQNRTFRCILSTLLSVGIFLNGAPVKGFQIEYLAKVPEVKDTVHKHSLLHHLCHMVMESSSDTSDLYSEIGPITRASKADFTDLAHNLTQLESECKASWDRLKLIAKHDCAPPLKQKLVDFLADCAERIIILQIVHRRVMNRYRKFLLWLGMPQHSVAESRPNEFCRTLSEFALEYRTTRERVQQQLEKKANHRERNKTRGKLIIDMAQFKTKEDHADDELKQLLGTSTADSIDGTLTWRRRRAEQLRSPIARHSEEQFTDGDDEILESLVKTATKAPGTRTTPRERKRTRHADRKSLRRTLKNGLTDEEKQHVAALIQTY